MSRTPFAIACVLLAAAASVRGAAASASAAASGQEPAATSAATAITPAPGLGVEGTAFVLRQSDGNVLRSPDLVGAELAIGGGVTLRIDAVRRDPGDERGEIWLHTLSALAADGTWQSLCDADREGHREGFPLAGRWLANGRFDPDPAHFAVTCTSGAQGKCARFGYRPWRQAADGTPLLPLFEACVRKVRADNCGDGVPTTRDGTLIDMYDRHGVQRSESGPELTFEAGWAPEGAVCVAHPRIRENVTLEQLAERCPRLRGALGEACTEDAAAAAGAVLFNRSR
jgi:hypothetical protein